MEQLFNISTLQLVALAILYIAACRLFRISVIPFGLNIQRNDFTEGMKKDMYDYFFETYDDVPTVYDQVFEESASDGAYEQSTSVIGLGELTETEESDPITYRKFGEGFTVYGKNRTFTDGFKISMEAVEDNRKIDNVVKDAAQGWGRQVRISREKFFAKFFNNGGLTAGHDVFKNIIPGVLTQNVDGLLYDAKPFFNLSGNTRASKGGGTYYNGHALALTHANLKTVWNHMTTTTNRDEKDQVIAIMPNVILVPPALLFDARVILESMLLPGSGNNDKNVLANLVTPIPWHYLTDTDAWFLGVRQRGIKYLNRKEPVIDFYYDEDDKHYKANIVARWGAMIHNWRFWQGSNFSSS